MRIVKKDAPGYYSYIVGVVKLETIAYQFGKGSVSLERSNQLVFQISFDRNLIYTVALVPPDDVKKDEWLLQFCAFENEIIPATDEEIKEAVEKIEAFIEDEIMHKESKLEVKRLLNQDATKKTDEKSQSNIDEKNKYQDQVTGCAAVGVVIIIIIVLYFYFTNN